VAWRFCPPGSRRSDAAPAFAAEVAVAAVVSLPLPLAPDAEPGAEVEAVAVV